MQFPTYKYWSTFLLPPISISIYREYRRWPSASNVHEPGLQVYGYKTLYLIQPGRMKGRETNDINLLDNSGGEIYDEDPQAIIHTHQRV